MNNRSCSYTVIHLQVEILQESGNQVTLLIKPKKRAKVQKQLLILLYTTVGHYLTIRTNCLLSRISP